MKLWSETRDAKPWEGRLREVCNSLRPGEVLAWQSGFSPYPVLVPSQVYDWQAYRLILPRAGNESAKVLPSAFDPITEGADTNDVRNCLFEAGFYDNAAFLYHPEIGVRVRTYWT